MSTPQGEGRFGGNSNPSNPRPKESSGSGNVFTRKLGPLPLWAWMGIGLAIALGFYFWKQNSAAKSSTAGQSITPPGTSPDQTVAGSQIPQFVNLTNIQNAQEQSQTGETEPPTPIKPKPVPAQKGPTGTRIPWNTWLKKGGPNLVGMSYSQAKSELSKFQKGDFKIQIVTDAKGAGFPEGSNIPGGLKVLAATPYSNHRIDLKLA